MRVKNVWNVVPIPAKLKLLADRVTLSKLTIIYFVFSVLHFVIQIIFQVGAFKINENAARFLNSVIVQGNVSAEGFTVWEDSTLRWCTSVPNTLDASHCQILWNATQAANSATTLVNNGVSPAEVFNPFNETIDYASVSSTPSSVSSVSSSSSSVIAPSSSSVSSASAPPTSSASQAAATTVKVTVTNIAQLQTALQALEAGSFSVTESPSVPTVTVTVKSAATPSPTADVTHEHKKRALNFEPKVVSTLAVNGTTQITVHGLPGKPNDVVTLSQSCLVALNWPLARVDNTKREDIVFIGFSFWVLGMSLVALLNESPPHIVASFLTHALATGWSAFQIVHTQAFRKDFTRLATRGVCDGVNLLPTYWAERQQFEIPTLVFNAVALLISAVLSWKLMKSFGWQTFKRIGASLTMSRAYRIILIFSIVIQLSVFFVVVSVALWIDQVYNGDIGHLTERANMFKGIMIAILLLILPWLTIGWISVRREQRIPMIVFLVLSLGYTVGWSSMFLAPTFKWTFVEWFFFSLMATASVILALATFILGIICRCNFGKGLPRYLNAQQPLPGDDFEPAYPAASDSYIADKQWGSDEEKVDFPSYDTSVPIPPYAQVPAPPPAHVQNGQRVLGPRFYQANANMPFDQRTSQGAAAFNVALTRQTSGSSQHSTGSIGSMKSVSSSYESSSTMRGKRWVIE